VIVLDTTVLVYAVGEDHRHRDPARSIVEAVEDGRIQATTTVEAIQELVHVRARRRDRADAAALGRAYLALLSPLLHPSEEDLVAGLRLFEREDSLGAFDAVLAAAAFAAGADALGAAVRSVADVRGLRWDLGGDELATLLGA
jgi:predicted nucleic acid-binding protein